jgi:AcrR family transcriptional regulator
MVEKLPPDKTALILQAAQKRFAHYGLLKTTMNDIADDLGISKASLYYYYPDKQSLFAEVIQQEQEQFLTRMKKIIDETNKVEELLTTYVQKRLDYFENLLNLSKLTADNIKSVKPIFASLSEKFTEREIALIKSILKKGVHDHEFEKMNIAEHSELFIALIQGLRVNAVHRSDRIHLEEKDYHALRKQSTAIAKIFTKGIKK